VIWSIFSSNLDQNQNREHVVAAVSWRGADLSGNEKGPDANVKAEDDEAPFEGQSEIKCALIMSQAIHGQVYVRDPVVGCHKEDPFRAEVHVDDQGNCQSVGGLRYCFYIMA
jgi:hypothetical protein